MHLAAFAAEQQGLAQKLLQPLNLHRNGGLGAPNALGRSGETAVFRDIGEGAEKGGVDGRDGGHGYQY
jgi:hypothetical protein